MGGHIVMLCLALVVLCVASTASVSASESNHKPPRQFRHHHHHHHQDHIISTAAIAPLSTALPLGRKKGRDASRGGGPVRDDDYSGGYHQPGDHHADHGHGTENHKHGGESQARLDMLIQDKLIGYERLARPIPDCSSFDCTHRIKVFMGLSFRKLIELNQADGSLTMVVWLRLTWPDYRLRYNATEYFGDVPMFGEGDHFNWDSQVDSVPISQDAVWMPDVQLVNAIKEPEDINRNPRIFWFDEQKLRDTGYNMMMVVPKIIDVNCPVSLRDFPFDKQSCRLEFGDWSASEQYFEFDTIDRGASQMEMSETNQDFSFKEVTVAREKQAYSALETTRFPEIVYTLSLTRYPHYYLLHFVLPQFVLVLLGQGIYWMNIEGERLSTGITVILAVMTVSFLTAPMLPETNEVMWLERFQVGCYVLTCVPVFVSMLLDHAKHMELCNDVWLDHFDNCARVVHPFFVLVFYIFMFRKISWPRDQYEVSGFLFFNVAVYVVFAVAGLVGGCQFCGRFRRDANKLKLNDAAMAYKTKADDDLAEEEAQQAPPQVSVAELRDAVEALRRAVDGGAGPAGRSSSTLAFRS